MMESDCVLTKTAKEWRTVAGILTSDWVTFSTGSQYRNAGALADYIYDGVQFNADAEEVEIGLSWDDTLSISQAASQGAVWVASTVGASN